MRLGIGGHMGPYGWYLSHGPMSKTHLPVFAPRKVYWTHDAGSWGVPSGHLDALVAPAARGPVLVAFRDPLKRQERVCAPPADPLVVGSRPEAVSITGAVVLFLRRLGMGWSHKVCCACSGVGRVKDQPRGAPSRIKWG